MLKELKFVMGAVAKKDLIPGMQHFAIENNTIRAYNGALALCAPLAFDIDCKPNAVQMVKAISNCNDAFPVTISMIASGRLRIKNGPYTVLVDCITEETPHVQPTGDIVHFDGAALRKAFEVLLPFVGTDASRGWTNGVLLHAQSAYATNNVIICEFWLGTEVPCAVNIPSDAIREFLRVGEDPTHAQVSENSITFHFSDGRWISSRLYSTEWPIELISGLLNRPSTPNPLDPKIFEGLDAIRPFVGKIADVYFEKGTLATHLEEDVGARYALEDFPHNGVYALDMLKMLEGVVKTIDWSMYPEACSFQGDMLRGVIAGRHHPRDNGPS